MMLPWYTRHRMKRVHHAAARSSCLTEKKSIATNKEGNRETRQARMGRKQVVQGTEGRGREQGAE